MSPLDRNRSRLRLLRLRRSTPIVENLESRHLLSATPVTHELKTQVHAEVIASPTSAKHAVETSKTATTKAIHVKTAVVTEKAATTKPAASKAKPKTVQAAATPKLKTITIKSKLINLHVQQGLPNPVTGPTSGGVYKAYSPVAGALSPGQLETAYGTNLLGSSNQGQGETIAIIDEFNDPNIISDANSYSAYYNLPQFNTGSGPTMTVTLDNTLGTVTSAAGTGVGPETSLDVEMVHAMAPQANILLVEVPATGTNAQAFAELLQGVQYAAGQPGVVAVSLSYGLSESSIGNTNVKNLDNTYLETGAAQNVAVTVSTGDGSTPLFPATAPDVVAVGGTSLYISSVQGRYFYETAWGGLAGAGAGGGGPSTNFAAPTFQSANGVALSTKRTIPDISMVGDPVTAVSIYDSLDAAGGSPWESTGGTSVAAPLTAGVIGLAQQERLAAGEPLLNSVEVDTAIYEAYNSSAYSTYFHDITIGNNSNVNSRGKTTVTGYKAGTGYDEATGIGSPIANALVPYLSSYVIGT